MGDQEDDIQDHGGIVNQEARKPGSEVVAERDTVVIPLHEQATILLFRRAEAAGTEGIQGDVTITEVRTGK